MSLKLYYWNVRGAAQHIRTLLKYLDVEFEEINPTKEDWPALKQSFIDGGFNFPNLPMIEDRDFKLSESKAILTYLAQTKGDGTLIGKTPQDQAIIRQIDGVVEDVFNILKKSAFVPDFKEKLQEAAGNEKLTRVVDRLEKHFADGREFVVGYFTIADLIIAGAYSIVNDIFKSAEVDNPMEKKVLYDHSVRVANLSRIKEYYASDEYKNKGLAPIPWLKKHPLTEPSN